MKKNKAGAIIIEGHIQGLSNTRSLGEIGIPVYVVDKNDCIARYSKYCNKFFICPDYNDDRFADFLIDLAHKEGINNWVLIPSNDYAVLAISKNKRQLEKCFKIITPSFDVLENIYNKANLLQIALLKDIPIPSTHYFLNEFDVLPDNFTFPVITKGKFGLEFYKTFKKKVFLAESENQLKAQVINIAGKYPVSDTFTQEVIPSHGQNKTISFAAFSSKGEILSFWMGEKLREHPVKFGTATFSQSIYNEDILKTSKILLKELNYTGPCEIEFLKDPRDDKYKLIEMNARTWLWVGLAKACGIDFAKMIYYFANDLPFAYPLNYKTNIKWRNSFTDIVYTFIAIIKGVTSLRTVIYQNKGLIIDAIALKCDNKPFWAYLYLSISYLFRR